MLLEVDGLDERWEEGIPSDWEGTLGQHDEADVLNFAPPFALARLHSPSSRRAYDASALLVEQEEAQQRVEVLVVCTKQNHKPE